MTWTLAALKAADAAVGLADLSAAAAALNGQTTSAAHDIQWSAVRDVLMNSFDWGSLVQAATITPGTLLPGGGMQTMAIQAAAAAIRECCLYGGTFQASSAATWNRLVAASALLTPSAVGAISSASAAAVAALRTSPLPTWSPAVTAGDLQTARGQP